MGNNANCGCIEKHEDLDLITENEAFILSKRSRRNNKINLSLFSLLKDKMLHSNITINSITKEYLNDLIDQNPKASSIIESYTNQLRTLYNESSRENYLPPLQFINRNDNSVEYYEAEYNTVENLTVWEHIYLIKIVYI